MKISQGQDLILKLKDFKKFSRSRQGYISHLWRPTSVPTETAAITGYD